MARTLRNLKIHEVSGVDKGAGRGVKILLMKRDTGDGEGAELAVEDVVQATGALAKSICSILCDDKVSDPKAEIAKTVTQFQEHLSGLVSDDMEKNMDAAEIQKLIDEGVKKATDTVSAELAKRDAEIVLLKMSAAHKAHYDGLKDEDAKKKFSAMSGDERDAACKKADTTAADPVATAVAEVTKKFTEQNDSLSKRLAEFENKEQKAVFAKRAVEAGLKEEDGEIMRKAFSGDPDAQVELIKRQSAANAALKEQAKAGKLFGEMGKSGAGGASTAYGELMAKAAELRKTAEGAKLTEAQAFTKVYTDSSNREIANRYRDEQMAKIAGAAPAQ